MAKFLGLLMVFSCGALLGWGKALGMNRRARELEKWREFLKEFRIHLEATRSSPREIVRMLGKQNAFTDSPGIQALRSAFEMDSSFSRCLGRALEGKGLPPETVPILMNLADVVGARPLEEQLSALETAELLMAREGAAARERSRQYGGLCQRLGVLLGLMAVVILA